MSSLIGDFADILRESVDLSDKERLISNLSDYEDLNSGGVPGLLYDEDINALYTKHETEILRISEDIDNPTIRERVMYAWSILYDDISSTVLMDLKFKVKMPSPLYEELKEREEFAVLEFSDAFTIDDGVLLFEPDVYDNDELEFELKAMVHYTDLPYRLYAKIDDFIDDIESFGVYGDEEYEIVPDYSWVD